MVGLVSYFLQGMFRGTWLKEIGFYLSLPAGSIGGLSSVGMRAHLSKVVPRDDLGKIFSLVG